MDENIKEAIMGRTEVIMNRLPAKEETDFACEIAHEMANRIGFDLDSCVREQKQSELEYAKSIGII